MYSDHSNFDDPENEMRVWIVEKSRIDALRCRHRLAEGRSSHIPMIRGYYEPFASGVTDVQDHVLKAMWPSPRPDEFHTKYAQVCKQRGKTRKYFDVYKERLRMLRIMRETLHSSGSGEEEEKGGEEESESDNGEERREDEGEGERGGASVAREHRQMSANSRDPGNIPERRESDERTALSGAENDEYYRQPREQRQRQQHQQRGVHGSRRTLPDQPIGQEGVTTRRNSTRRKPTFGKAHSALQDDVIWEDDDENTFLMADMFKDEIDATRGQHYRGTFIKPSG